MEIFNKILLTEKSSGYELLDSGEGQKLERFGDITLSRPDPQVLWKKGLSQEEWDKADAVFSRKQNSSKWNIKGKLDQSWKVNLNDITFNIKLLPSKHLGIFPEQVGQWRWLEEKIKSRSIKNKKVSVLNLFAYTGGATISSAKAGAEVCHVDSSEFVVGLAKQNLKDSGLGEKPVRFIVDDARKFVERELKRGNKYDVVLMDPPVYGKGIKKEVWKIEEDLLPLLSKIKKILSDDPLAVVLNGYASNYSGTTYSEVLDGVLGGLGGTLESGELAIKESKQGRLLTAGIFARWSK